MIIHKELPVDISDEQEDEFDPTNPSYYKNGKVECIDAIETATKDLDGMEAYCVGNIIKYVWRFKQKNGAIDISKAIWYANKLYEHETMKGDQE